MMAGFLQTRLGGIKQEEITYKHVLRQKDWAAAIARHHTQQVQ
jgi:hypothetical protein